METLFELWGKRNPEWEKRYQSTIMDVFTDYGKGVNQYQDIRGKIFGAGYEIYIIAFFIGLYFNQTKPLVEDKAKRKVLGQAIMYWGNVENRLGRNSYGKIRDYMFAALIAKTNVDLIALDKGDITARSVVDELITKMEQYANFGFDYIEEQLENDPNYFFKESAFLRVFTSFLSNNVDDDDEIDDEPDTLDDDEPEALDIPIDNKQVVDNPIDEEKLRMEAEKPWNQDDVDRLKLYFENDMEISEIAERLGKSIYSVQFRLAQLGLIKMPLNVTVNNTDTGGTLRNNNDEVVYTDNATLKIIGDKVYRFNFKSECLTIKDIIRTNEGWVKGSKIMVAYPESELYHQLSRKESLEYIEDLVEGDRRETNKIKVNGKWYDYYGDVILDKAASNNSSTLDEIQNGTPVLSQKRWSATEKRELKAYYESGMSIEKLASFFETSEENIIDVLKKLKIYR